jgi:hypothetical protein
MSVEKNNGIGSSVLAIAATAIAGGSIPLSIELATAALARGTIASTGLFSTSFAGLLVGGLGGLIAAIAAKKAADSIFLNNEKEVEAISSNEVILERILLEVQDIGKKNEKLVEDIGKLKVKAHLPEFD